MRSLAAEALGAMDKEGFGETFGDFGVGRRNVVCLCSIVVEIHKSRAELVGLRAGAGGGFFPFGRERDAVDPLPRAAADRVDAAGALQNEVATERLRGGLGEEGGEDVDAVGRGGGAVEFRFADDGGERGKYIDDADQLIARGAGGNAPGPAHEEGHFEATFPDVVFAAAKGAVDFQAGVHGGFARARLAAGNHAAVVARENDDRVLEGVLFFERGDDPADAVVEVVDEISVGAGFARALRFS